jgi:short-subunit dehydrogenase
MTFFHGWGGAALVTGASGGIGLELARRFAARGLDLILAARSAENLRIHADRIASAHHVRVVAVPVDLSRPNGPSELLRALRDIDLTIDVLVNNAAFGTYGPFANRGPRRETEMIRLNVSAPTEITARVLPGMLRRRRGLLLNVASTAGFYPVPWLGTYAAAKAYLVSWTHALAAELRGSGVRVVTLCPGNTDTQFQNASGEPAGKWTRWSALSAADVAEECLRGLDRGKRVIVTGRLNRVVSALTRLLPPSVAATLAARVTRPKGSG